MTYGVLQLMVPIKPHEHSSFDFIFHLLFHFLSPAVGYIPRGPLNPKRVPLCALDLKP